MIQVDSLSLSYHAIPILENVSFTIGEGERCGLVGRNGSGKTSLLRLLMNTEQADEGSISIAKGYKLGYLNQYITLSCNTLIEEACLGLPESDRDDVYKAEKLLFGLGFQEMNLEKDPKDLSGGFQLRLHLVKLLLSEPNCLLLDEPTNYLDLPSMRFLQRLLRRLDSEFVLITHDREFMDTMTTHTLGIHRKGVRKIKGSTIDFFEKIVEEEKIYEKTKLNLEKKKAHLQNFISRFGAKATKATQAKSKQKTLDRIPALEALASLNNLDFNFREKLYTGKKLATLENVHFSYGNDPLIIDFSLEIAKGDRIGIIGKNGYGKSTLLKLISQEIKPNQGSIVHSDSVATGYFGQTNVERLHQENTIEEEIRGSNPKLTYSDVKSICGQMMFSGDVAKKKIEVLSGGEKSRVLLGKILAEPINLLLLDEPTHHLDIESVEALIDALETFSETFIIVTHSELILKRLSLNKLIICHQNRQEHFLGTYEEFLEKAGWEEEKAPSKKTKEPKSSSPKESPRIKEAQKIEALIMTLEEEQTKDHERLSHLSHLGDLAKVHEVAKLVEHREQEISQLYQKLTQLFE